MKNSRPFAGVQRLAFVLALALIFCAGAATGGGGGGGVTAARAQSDEGMSPDQDARTENAAATTASAGAVRRLSSRDPLERQRAAEELARTAPPEQRRMVEGYRLQEKDARVRLALDWALYRMGKTEALFAIVRNLDGSRRNQSAAYLSQLEGPEPLYIFLERANDNTKVQLLEVLARLGDAGTIDRINPYAASVDPRVAGAAQFALREINRRQLEPERETRPRQVGSGSEETEMESETEETP
ncbi:MAG TPA: hypothetical protein VGX92_21980 [Pyrinomonadaceae bacterium]|jgi:hemin uptake protein HemP|nr:hypothetical protein [Pyrinomonadaceae bacterium]